MRGEIHAAVVASVDEGARTCTVVFPDDDGGRQRSPALPYRPRLVGVDDDGLVLEHPRRGDAACVLEDATGGLWFSDWTPDD
ncbi:hypothetical protein [Patulibacter sp. SYSU D01012]|uniref:hypothetical protein n=1 Tax=Patulibacter sp. SYSU D01012 TaxID=2817381 RepID=UPI001B318628|nr:hypothetical protein [Patulibacter sp. SYSU D01012]